MRTPQRSLAWILAAIAALVLPWSSQQTVAAQASKAEHLAAILIIDDSGSMRGNDPQNLRYADAQLFVSLLDEQDAIGALRFATTSSPITNGIEVIADPGQHNRLIEALAPGQADGFTDMLAAFEQAAVMRQAFTAQNYKVAVIFLTDGKPEIPAMTAAYEMDALQAARRLNAPVLSIALTSEGQSPFLNRVAAETGGQVISAASANDLLDVYLQLLSDLKDRTVLGMGNPPTPGSAELLLDPALMPYVDQISFAISRPAGATTEITMPDGHLLPADPSGQDFSLQNSRFDVITWNRPVGGAWRFALAGNGAIQVRAILYSRLRAQLVDQRSTFETNQPLPLVVRLVEEQPGQDPVTIIGEASFAAWITRPDGQQDSLDHFYDDGTHGDALAGDGDYTRLYVNTGQPGAYLVQVRGHKGTVPVSTQTQILAVPAPQMVIDQPRPQIYEIREQPVPLRLHLEGTQVNELDQGRFDVSITSPGGRKNYLTMESSQNGYSAAFLPSENGIYRVRFTAQGATYQGIPYTHELETSFEARIISTLRITRAQLGVHPSGSRFDQTQASLGIPLAVTLFSNAPHPVTVSAHLDGLAGFTLTQPDSLSVPAESSATITFHLAAEPNLPIGAYQGQMVITAPDGVDLLNDSIPISFETFVPEISIHTSVISTNSPDSCLTWAPVQVVLQLESSSLLEEEIHLQLEGLPDISLSQSPLTVAPGASQVTLTLVPEERKFAAGRYAGTLVVEGLRTGVRLTGSSRIPIVFTVDPLWISCRRPMIFSGAAVGFTLTLLTGLIVRARRKSMPPIVKGSLVYWELQSPALTVSIDLTAIGKTEVKIGKASLNDIIIADESLLDVHATIRAERDENGALRCILCPKAGIHKGYRVYTSELPLEEKATYRMGNRGFQYFPDLEG